MQSPLKVVTLLRPSTRRDLLAATAYSSFVFTATPFLIPAVADKYGVSVGTASLISSAQLLGFVAASAGAPRVARPSRGLLVACLVLAAAVNVAFVVLPGYGLLLALRVVGGAALGAIAWLGWQEVFGEQDRMGDLAVIGPVIGIVGAPLAAGLAQRGGADAVFLTLAVLALVPIPIAWGRPELVDRGASRHRRSRPIPTARVILGCLGVLTMGGSAVFVFGAAIGTERVGLDPVVVSLAFSANAAMGIPPARYRGARRWSGLWMMGTAVAALLMSTVQVGPIWWIAVACWGFAFWAGIPGVFTLLAERSVHPVDRAGDAQSIMAAGRVVGPLGGGALVATGSYATLGVVAASVMAIAAITLVGVERWVPPRSTPPIEAGPVLATHTGPAAASEDGVR